jgi:hypothetical protein
MPVGESAFYDGYFYTSPECWMVFAEVVGTEFSSPPLFGRAHQLTVDTYAVQHAGGSHPDKSIGVHLSGLYLVLERGFSPISIPGLLQRLASAVRIWPHFPPPPSMEDLTVLNVALSDLWEDHINTVWKWAAMVWDSWSPYHSEIANLVTRRLSLDEA